jgi:acyl dehydratase
MLQGDRGKYYEDASLGDEYESPARTISEADIVAFAGLTGDYGPMHADDVYCRQTLAGRRAAHGLLGLGVVEGLLIRVPPGEGRGIASLSWLWRFRAPVVAGDTVRARWAITWKRRSRSRPDRGIVEESVRLENQRGEVVQEGVHAILLACRTDGNAEPETGSPRGGELEADHDEAAARLLATSLAPSDPSDRMAVYFEDLEPGRRFTSPRRTVTETDVVSFAAITGDYAMIHTDEEYCRATEFGTRVAHGLLGLSLVEGLKRRVNPYAGTGGTMTSLALTWSFRRPIVAGDTVHVAWAVSKREACPSLADGGWLVEDVRLVNQRAEVVQEGRQIQAIRRRPPSVP